MCHVTPYGVPTAQGRPLPLPPPSWATRMASGRESSAFGEQDEGLAVPIPACSKVQTPTPHSPPRPAVAATPQQPPHALLRCWCFSLPGHKHHAGGHGLARQPPALTAALAAPIEGRVLLCPPQLRCSALWTPDFLSGELEMGQGSGLPPRLAVALSTFSDTRSSFAPGAAPRGQTPGEGLWSPGPPQASPL